MKSKREKLTTEQKFANVEKLLASKLEAEKKENTNSRERFEQVIKKASKVKQRSAK